MIIKLKRISDDFSMTDGFRVFVDCVWPRVVVKSQAHIDVWLKEVAPSNQLRIWYKLNPHKWPEFQFRYKQELTKISVKKQALRTLRLLTHDYEKVTLLHTYEDQERNNAVVLKEIINSHKYLQ